jgi:hypothetical protein
MNDLDSGWHVRRSQAHTSLLVEEFELGMLWNEYGLVGDIAVCIFFLRHRYLLYPMSGKLVPLGLLAYSRGRYAGTMRGSTQLDDFSCLGTDP